MLKAAVVPDVISQHVPRDVLGVLSRLFIPGQFVAVRIGDSPPPAHDDIEKVSRHGLKMGLQPKGCSTKPYQTVPTFSFFETNLTSLPWPRYRVEQRRNPSGLDRRDRGDVEI